jgi:hypothetical protein
LLPGDITNPGTFSVNREECICYSGGANGAEAAFGAAAERYGIDEINFTFEGHASARQRGRRELTRAELRQGDVSLGYLSRLMHRAYPDTPLFRKVLQTIWHQVQCGKEIFIVGKINSDATVTGGTGVAAEFAKLFNKPVNVFDQVRLGWFRWSGEIWEPAGEPVIRLPLFCGTGTRFLTDDGRAAIEALFARSFG